MAIQMLGEEFESKKAMLNAYGFFWKRVDNGYILEDRYGDRIEEHQAINEIKARRVEKMSTQCYLERPAALLWAKMMSMIRPVYLDTECTGLKGQDVVIQIGVKDHDGATLMNTLINNAGVPIHEKAIATHHISEEMLREAPSFANVWPEIERILRTRSVIIYNSHYDIRMLRQTCTYHELAFPSEETLNVHCLMRHFAEYYGVTYPGGNTYASQKLDRACELFGIPAGGHDALADAEATRRVVEEMAKVAL